MWIKREDYGKSLMDKYEEGKKYGLRLGAIDGHEEERKLAVSFPAYYQERMEWWKERFDKKPKNHRLIVSVDGDGIYSEETDSIESLRIKEEAVSKAINEKQKEVLIYPVIVVVDKIISYKTEINHPDPYTPFEIEAWAKEKVEEEMKGWRVVREEPGNLIAELKSLHDRQMEMMQKMYPSLWRGASIRGLHAD